MKQGHTAEQLPSSRAWVEARAENSYPFGAHGFDAVKLEAPGVTTTQAKARGHYPFGAHGFEGLTISECGLTQAELRAQVHYPFGAHGFDAVTEAGTGSYWSSLCVGTIERLQKVTNVQEH